MVPLKIRRAATSLHDPLANLVICAGNPGIREVIGEDRGHVQATRIGNDEIIIGSGVEHDCVLLIGQTVNAIESPLYQRLPGGAWSA